MATTYVAIAAAVTSLGVVIAEVTSKISTNLECFETVRMVELQAMENGGRMMSFAEKREAQKECVERGSIPYGDWARR